MTTPAQEQFLDIVSKDEAIRRLRAAYPSRPLPAEEVLLADALGRVLAADIVAPGDVPPFDRAVVDGFAVLAADTVGASEAAPRRLALNAQRIHCGMAPGEGANVAPGTATVIATGGMIPRGADAVVMVEWTDAIEGGDAIEVRRAVAPGQGIASAGSDLALGETVLPRGTRLGAREIGLIAACGLGRVLVVRQPLVAVISTGDELIAPGEALPPAGIHDSNSAILSATIAENGGVPRAYGVIRDDEAALARAVEAAMAECDMVVLSGGTSKGSGDKTHRIIAGLGEPGIFVHGVALKPGKPLLLALARGKPVAVLPGFPTSAIVTFRTFLVPLIRAMAGLSVESEARIVASVPIRFPSEMGRTEFAFVSLARGEDGLVAYPVGKGSGAVSAFSQADGFIEIDALADGIGPNARVDVRLFDADFVPPDLVVAGSHCVGLDAVLGHLREGGLAVRGLALGSLGGVAAVRRGEADIAPIHLVDPSSGVYNMHLAGEGYRLVKGWRRMQGIAFRPNDPRFSARDAPAGIAAALADPDVVMVNRNAGAGTRVLIDRLIGTARPRGWTNQPRSHNAVAVAIAQRRADWGVTIASVARAYGLDFLPLQEEHYDFLLAEARSERPALRAFLEALGAPRTLQALAALGFEVGR